MKRILSNSNMLRRVMKELTNAIDLGALSVLKCAFVSGLPVRVGSVCQCTQSSDASCAMKSEETDVMGGNGQIWHRRLRLLS